MQYVDSCSGCSVFMLERKGSLFIITDSIIKTRYGFISQPHTPLSGKDLLSHRRHQAALQGLFLSFPFLSVSSMYAATIAHYHLSFTSSSYWAPFPPNQPSSTSVSLFSADIMQEVTCCSSLCHNCSAHAIPRSRFHSSSPHLPGPTRVSGSCMGWYRCYTFGWGPESQLFASFWPVLSLCMNCCRS